ncbi:Ig-like domain-containing protein [Bradyrhizobium sp. USDA 3650]
MIGHVATVTGSASIVRNGVTIEANNGDVVYQNDVVQTGSGSTIGLVLIDGSTFNLSANARFMLNDLGYDGQNNANGTLVSLTDGSNHSLFTLMQGAVSFVAGQVAKTGDMQVATPSAVIGIRGTAVLLNVDSVDGQVSISVADQHDGQIHSVQVFKCVPGSVLQGACVAGDSIGIVTSDGPSLSITPTANLEVVTQVISKSQSQVAQEFIAFQQVLTTYDIGKQLAPNTPPPSDGKRGDVDTKSLQKFAGSPPPSPTEASTTVIVDDVKGQVSGGSITPPTVTLALITGSSSSATKPLVPALDTTQAAVVAPFGAVIISNTGGPINHGSQTISGTAGAAFVGTTVTLYDTYDGVTTQIASVTVGSGGAWSTAVTLAGDGTHSIVARFPDASNNPSVPVVFTLDTTAPTVAITSTGGATNQASQTITGTVDVADAGATVTILDGTATIGTAVVQGNGSWSATVTLNNGSNSLTAQVSDAAGNTATSSAVVYTVSTTGPAVTEALVSDTGSSATDHLTTSPALSGTGLASTVVHFTIDGVASTTTVTTDAQGAWSFTPSGLADGLHTIVASQTDSFGNTGSASLSFTLDTTAPAVAITTIEGGDNLINAAEAAGGVQISGTAEIGSALTVNGAAVTVDATGHWTTSITPAGQGALAVTAIATDAAGNTASTSTTLTVDTVAPAVAITSTGGATNQASQTITGTVDVADAGATVTILDGTATIGTAVVQGNGSWSATVTLNNGSNSLTAQVSDAAGNTATSSAVVYTVSTTGPAVTEALVSDTGSSATDHLTTSPALSGTGLASTVVHFTIDGVASTTTVTTDAQGAWSFTPSGLADGLHTIVASQTDSFGNTGSASLSFTLDTTAPAVAITTIEGGDNLINAAEAAGGVQISGTAEIGSALTVNGAAVTVDATGHWTTSITPAGQGALAVTAIATDAAGNTASTSTTLTVDTVAPAVAITSTGGATNQASQTITGTVDVADAGATVTILDGTATIGTAVVQGNGSWSATVTLNNGSNSLTAQVSDAAGNTATSSAVVYTVSTTGPAVTEALVSDTGSSATDHLTTSPALSGTGLASTVVHFTIDGVASTTTVTTDAQGAWSFTPSGLADGLHTIVASQTDSFGNTGSASLSFTLDTTAPAVAITTIEGGDNLINAAEAAGGVQVSGTAEIGSSLAVNGAAVTVDATGHWTTSITPAGQGALAVTAIATDAAGNTASTSTTLTVDTVAPAVAITSTGGATNQASQTITGTVDVADAGATVTILDGTATIGTAVVQGNGSWSATVTLNNGSNSLTAQVSDAAGNTATSSAVVYTVSTTGPAVTEALVSDTGSSATDHLTTSPALSGTGLASTVVHFTIDGVASTTTVTTDAQGAWSFTPSGLADGLHTIVASQTDSFGNTGSASLSFTLDTTAPAVAITTIEGGDNLINAAEAAGGVQVSGTAEIGSSLAVNGAAVTVDATGHWTTSITPAGQGALAVTAIATDAAGNTASTSTTLTVDTVAPAVAITTIEGGDNLINAAEAAGGVQISGTAEIGSSLTVNGAAVTVDATGHWTTSITPAGQGALAVTAIATDAAGNTASTSTTLTVDTVAPAVAITTIEGGDNLISAAEAAGGIQVSGTAEIGLALTVNGAAVTVDATGHWTTSITPAGQGPLVVTAIATDAAGNTASTSTTLTVDTIVPTGGTPDLVAASDTGQSNTDNVTSHIAPSFAISLDSTVAIGDTVQFLLNGSALLHPVAHVITSADVLAGSITLTVTAGDLGADGNKQVAAQFSDAAGNTSLTSALSFTIDTTGPTEALAITAIANSGGSASLTVSGTNGVLAVGEKIQISSDGGATWIDVLQNTPTSWSLVDAAAHPLHYTYQARIIDAAGNTGSVVSQAVNGESSSGVVAGNLNPANSSNVAVAIPASPPISGVYDGVKAFTFGSGNVSVSTASGASITGSKQYGIEAFSASSGSVSVTAAANSSVRSGSAGILAYNQAASISQLNGATTSTISVTANGTIESGTTLTGSGARPAGILAVYKGGTTNTVNPAVFGNVIIDNFASIVAAGGDGIRAYNYGSGNVTITDRAGSTISASDVFGISAGTYGSGQVSITMEAGAIVTSGSIGVQAINQATAIGVAAASTVSITARGTIHSGTHLTPGGSQPQGVSAGYYSNGVSNTTVNGIVSVDNFANVTADAGTGVNAYNWGNGAVTLLEEASTNVWGAQYGITAYSLSSGVGSSGSVTITVGPNATITAGALYGIIAIDASERNGGNISVTTSTGDIINSGGSGISASNQAVGTSSNPITGQISVTAFGTINSAFNMFTGGGQPGGIWSGYNAGGSQTVNTFVHGNVVIDTGATINAAAGVGVGLYNFGTGAITATLEQSSLINAVSAGLNIFAQGGGNVTIANHGAVTDPTGYGIVVGTGQPSTGGSGVISISNLHDAGGQATSGVMVALGSLSNATIQVNNWSNQGATVTNSGTIAATQFSLTRLNTAIGIYNGPNSTNVGGATVSNSGGVIGNVNFSAASFNISAASFNNNAGGVWNVNGQNYFGGVTNAINNAGTINASGLSIFSSSGPLAVNNTGSINVLAFGAALVFGNVSGQGAFTIGDHAALELGGSVAGGPTGQTITFVNGNGLLTLDSPSAFNGTIAGLSIGDTLDFLGGVTVSSASISGSTLTVTDSAHSQTYSYQVIGAASGTAFNVLSADKIVVIPISALFPTTTQRSFAPSSGSFYVLANDTISGTGVGYAVNSTDSSSADYATVQINQTSSISVSGTGVSLTTTGANIALINAGSITSTAGTAIATNSGSGSTDIVNYGSVSGQVTGIAARTNGAGLLYIVAGGSITGTTSSGISAISTLGGINVTTAPGLLINAGTNGILAQNQGTSVPAGSGAISISTSSGTINAGTSAISVSYLLGTSAPSTPPNPPNATVFGDITIENVATLNAAAGVGISASNYGVGNISVSNNASITATAAGITTPGTTSSQYGMAAFNYGSGKITVTTGYGSVINSGSSGINVSNQATAIAAAAASTVTVVALGSINSGGNNNNSGSAPSGIQAGYNPGLAGVFNANVWGDVLVNANSNIAAAAGDGINAYNYGNGGVTVNLGSNVNIQALTSATSATGKAPYGISASVYGPGDIAVTTASGDVITSGSSGISATNLATSIDVSAAALITIYAQGLIHSQSTLTNSGAQPSGIAAGFFGGTNATVNLNVNGRVIVNNDANIVANAGVGINAYHYGNGDITVNDASGTSVTGAQYGIEAHAEATGSTGNIAVNVYSGATITSGTSYGIFAFTKGSGNISIITSSGGVINAGSVGINATNEATSIDATANSSIVVTAAGTINSGTGLTGTGNPPAGVIAGYLGGTAIPASFPLTTLYGDVTVNNTANIVAAAGDGIRAYTFGIGDVTVNDLAGSITALGGSSPTNGFGAGVSANNYGSGNISISTAVGNVINSGSSGIAAINKAPSSGSFVVPSTSMISILSYASISSGSIPTAAGDAPAGILASYNPNVANVADDNVHGNIQIDDYGSISATAGTDGIRGENYGTGSVTITAEAGALIFGRALRHFSSEPRWRKRRRHELCSFSRNIGSSECHDHVYRHGGRR